MERVSLSGKTKTTVILRNGLQVDLPPKVPSEIAVSLKIETIG